MKILHINTALLTDAPGRIAEEIGKMLIAQGHQNTIAFGRHPRNIVSETIKIGTHTDQYMHVMLTRVLDRHGFGSARATERLIQQIIKTDPDVIHLHNLHGYYLNIRVLFDYLKGSGKPVVWTLHDCWAFTGHCSHYVTANCYKWQTECHHCPKKKSYPASLGLDNSPRNFRDKKSIFTGLSNLHFVSPSQWLAGEFKQSFLQQYPMRVIHNGIDIHQFSPDSKLSDSDKLRRFGDKPLVLGVASVWGKYKGLDDFLLLNDLLKDQAKIVLVGLNESEMKRLPETIIGIRRTESLEELAALYATASVFVNPTYADTFPTTNLEALSCGTPVISYDTGGSPEAIDKLTGIVVKKGDIDGLETAIKTIISRDPETVRKDCRERALKIFNKEARFQDYIELYQKLTD